MVKVDSQNPPGREAQMAALAARYCEDLGMTVSLHEAVAGRPSVVARASFGDGPVVCYCSHIDTVPVGDANAWKDPPLGARVHDGSMWGRGTCDAKGPITAALEAVALLRSADVPLSGTLELVLVCDEETMGTFGARHLVERGIVEPNVAIVGEPTSLRLVRAQRGVCWLKLTTRGRAAHGSAPERGVNAIAHMAELLRRLPESLPEEVSHPLLGGPSLNIGTIAGGEKVNVVPASCRAEVDRRTIPGERDEDVIAAMKDVVARVAREVPGLDAEVEVALSGRPFEIDEGARLVTEVAAALTEATGEEARLAGFRGASDARFFAEHGTEVVVCGPGDIAVAHTDHEHIDLDELALATVVYAVAFARLLAPRS
jgi:succinyl-diaminopimelate desuccinylase